MIPEIVPDSPSRSEGKVALFRVCSVLPVKGEVYSVPAWANYDGATGEYEVMEVSNILKFEETRARFIINVMWQTWWQLREEGRAKFKRA